MKFKLLTAFCLLTWLVFPPVFAQESKNTSSDLFQNAYNLLTMADEAKAEKNFSEASRLYRDAMDQYINLARKYPNMETEVVKFRVAYCDNQIQAILKVMNGNMAEQENRITGNVESPAEAEGLKKEATGDSPIDVTDLLARASASLAAGETEKAMRLLLDILRSDPGNTNARILVGITQCRAGRYDDAIKMMTPLVEEQPKNSRAFMILGTANFGLGRMEDAAAALARVIQLDSTNADAHYDMVQVIVATSPFDIAAARKNYKRSLELGGSKDSKLDYLLK